MRTYNCKLLLSAAVHLSALFDLTHMQIWSLPVLMYAFVAYSRDSVNHLEANEL